MKSASLTADGHLSIAEITSIPNPSATPKRKQRCEQIEPLSKTGDTCEGSCQSDACSS